LVDLFECKRHYLYISHEHTEKAHRISYSAVIPIVGRKILYVIL